MTKLWAAALCTISLTTAWAGCAGYPPIERESEAQDEAAPDPVVVDSKLDAGGARIDAARPPADLPDAGRAGDAATSAEEGPRRDAATQVKPADAGRDTGLPDAATPPVVVDAGQPPVVADAGPAVVPDAGRTGCLPGVYKGSFKGEISALLGAIRIDVAGDITIEVELGGSGDRLMIKTGVLQGTDTSEDKNPLFARIGGVLNCASKKIEEGTITDGTYNRVDPIWGGPPSTTTFAGTISGIYSTSPPAAVGTWTVRNASGTRTSMGTWDATLQ